MKNKHLLPILMAMFIGTGAAAQQLVPVKSFGTNGAFTISHIFFNYAGVNNALTMPDGKLLVGVSSVDEEGYYSEDWLFKITPAGELDSSFGTDGRLGADGVLAVQPDGAIILGSTYFDHNDDDITFFYVNRYTSNGQRDTTFGPNKTGGIDLDVSGFNNNHLYAVKVKSNGKILVFGNVDDGNYTTNDRKIWQLNQNGTLDSSFGDNGVLPITSPYVQNVNQVLMLPNDEFIILASYPTSPRSGYNKTCEVLYKANGTIDSTRGNNGIAFNGNLFVGSIALQRDHKLLGFGTSSVNNSKRGVLFRLNTDGTPDKTFGNNGRVITGSSDGKLLLQSDGRIIIASRQQLERYFADGSLDTTFGTNGVLTLPAIDNYYTYAFNKTRLYTMYTTPETATATPMLVVNAYAFRYNNDSNNNNLITGLKAVKGAADGIKLYPNPVKDKLTVTGLSNNTITNLQLIDATGRVMQKATTQNATFEWNIQALPTGIYYLTIIKDKTLPATFKIIKE